VLVEGLAADRLIRSQPGELYKEFYQNQGMGEGLGRNFIFSRRRSVLSYMAECGNITLISLVLEIGKIEINAKDKNGWTALSWAVERGHEAIVKLLLDKGAEVNAQGGYNALYTASRQGRRRQRAGWIIRQRTSGGFI
jgi:hypothetical protein